MNLRPLLIISLAATFALGCSTNVSDTEGRTFKLQCKSGPCKLQLQPATDASGDDANFVVNAEGRLLKVCPSKGTDFDCRALTCEASSQCSAAGPGFQCENQLCQNDKEEVSGLDRFSLCIAGTGDWKPTAEQRERLTVSRACEPPGCIVPPICRSL